MQENYSQHKLVIHVWPHAWDLHSFDASSLTAILYLQYTFPNHFEIHEETNPDASPSGQFPYLTHQHKSIAPLSSIILYLAKLNPEDFNDEPHAGEKFVIIPALDETLQKEQRTSIVPWIAYVEQNLGDLLAYTFFGVHENYQKLVRPLFVKMLPFPQKWYLPERLRKMHRPRLESLLLWDDEPQEERPEKKESLFETSASILSAVRPTQKFKTAYTRERMLTRARDVLHLIASLKKHDTPFYFGSRPCTLDIVIASHVMLILHAPTPDSSVKTLILNSYPQIAIHAHLTYAFAFPQTFGLLRQVAPSLVLASLPDDVRSRRPAPKVISQSSLPSSARLKQLLPPSFSSLLRPTAHVRRGERLKEPSAIRWGRYFFFAGSVVGMLAYMLGSGILKIEMAQDDEIASAEKSDSDEAELIEVELDLDPTDE